MAVLAAALVALLHLAFLVLPRCVTVAEAYGAWSVGRRILWVQALPGAVALALVLASG